MAVTTTSNGLHDQSNRNGRISGCVAEREREGNFHFRVICDAVSMHSSQLQNYARPLHFERGLGVFPQKNFEFFVSSRAIWNVS